MRTHLDEQDHPLRSRLGQLRLIYRDGPGTIRCPALPGLNSKASGGRASAARAGTQLEGCHPRLEDRKALTGILFVLKTGLPREDLPQEMGCGSGMTCRRRPRVWQADGTRDKIHRELLARRRGADKVDRSRAALDNSSVRSS